MAHTQPLKPHSKFLSSDVRDLSVIKSSWPALRNGTHAYTLVRVEGYLHPTNVSFRIEELHYSFRGIFYDV